MRLQRPTVGILILTGWLSIAASRAPADHNSTQFSNHRGGQGVSQTHSKANASHKPQWSADPTRGWVRTAERQDLPKPGAAAKTDRDNGKSKTSGKSIQER